jgi:hypothetical protein
MEDELLFKIRAVLDRGITEEMEVVYFLVEARKLMYRTSEYDEPTVRMYANWAIYSELSQKRTTTKRLLDAFETEYVEQYINGRTWRSTAYETFDEFRAALNTFLVNANLPIHTVEDDEDWTLFVMLYGRVISDCPITLTGHTTHISKVELVKGRGLQLFVGGKPLVMVNWKITPSQGKPIYRSAGIEKIVLKPGEKIPYALVKSD